MMTPEATFDDLSRWVDETRYTAPPANLEPAPKCTVHLLLPVEVPCDACSAAKVVWDEWVKGQGA